MSDWTEARARLEAWVLGRGPFPESHYVAAMVARVAELERHPCAQHDAEVMLAVERIKALEGEVARIAGQRDRAVAALKRYADHDKECDAKRGRGCDCGFGAATEGLH